MNASPGPGRKNKSARRRSRSPLPPGSPRPDDEVLDFIVCTESTLRVFDDRIEIIPRGLESQSVGTLYRDLRGIYYAAPVKRIMGSIQLFTFDDTEGGDVPTTLSFRDGASAAKCLDHVRFHAPHVEITQVIAVLPPSPKTQADQDAKEQRESKRRGEQEDKELRRLIAAEDRAKQRSARDARRAERQEAQKQAQIERPDGLRRDIWEAKKKVFDPNLRRRAVLRSLESKMRAGELVESMASCRYLNVESVVVMTNQRLLITGEILLKFVQVEYLYQDIQVIQYVGTTMTIRAGGSSTALRMIGFQGEPMAERLRRRVYAIRGEPSVGTSSLPTAEDVAAPVDVLDQLARLAQLHDAGVINDTEFAAKKAILLDRL